jgi:hypothetical protein
MTDELTPLTSWAQANRETIYPQLPVISGYVKGAKIIAEFGSPVDELKVRRGRLTAKVDGVWHIVPTGKTTP